MNTYRSIWGSGLRDSGIPPFTLSFRFGRFWADTGIWCLTNAIPAFHPLGNTGSSRNDSSLFFWCLIAIQRHVIPVPPLLGGYRNLVPDQRDSGIPPAGKHGFQPE